MEAESTRESPMKQYLLTIYQPDGPPPPQEFLEPIMRDVTRLAEEMKAAGAWVFSAGLHPPESATVLTLRQGEMLVTDGPYIEGKEHVGGFTMIQAPDLDAALEWARKLAVALPTLAIEVRPVKQHFDD
jgi:hypothetical protein